MPKRLETIRWRLKCRRNCRAQEIFTMVSSDTSHGSVETGPSLNVMPLGTLFLLQPFFPLLLSSIQNQKVLDMKSIIFKDMQPVDLFQFNNERFRRWRCGPSWRKENASALLGVASLSVNQLSSARWSSDCIRLKGWGCCIFLQCLYPAMLDLFRCLHQGLRLSPLLETNVLNVWAEF